MKVSRIRDDVEVKESVEWEGRLEVRIVVSTPLGGEMIFTKDYVIDSGENDDIQITVINAE